MPHEPPLLYVAELTGCQLLPSLVPGVLTEMFAAAMTDAGATIVESLAHQFPGGGQTCVLILAESHAVLHTWPETGTVNLDIFSCTPRLKSHAAIAALRQAFGATSASVREITRADGHLLPCDPRA